MVLSNHLACTFNTTDTGPRLDLYNAPRVFQYLQHKLICHCTVKGIAVTVVITVSTLIYVRVSITVLKYCTTIEAEQEVRSLYFSVSGVKGIVTAITTARSAR